MPDIVIIGRTNVGKSTLFNRLIGRRKALVHEMPGTTRDRNEETMSWEGKRFTLIDTGGWANDDEIFSLAVRRQLEIAMAKADLVLFVVDGQQGFHPLDAELANLLRKNGRKVLLVVNKIDTGRDESRVADFYRLGFADVVPVSANHGLNIYELMDFVVANVGVSDEAPEQGQSIKMILVGKPNVGKSSLVNSLTKQERSIVHDAPGTTREALDTVFHLGDRTFVLVDTPGLHRKRKFKDDMEYLSSLSAWRAMERADVALLVMDPTQGIGETETKIAEMILENRKACLMVINKWDLVEEREEAVKKLRAFIESRFRFMLWSKILLTSAKTGQRTERIFSEVESIYAEFTKIVPELELRQAVRDAETRKPLSRHGEVLRIREVHQTDTRPPRFSFTVNDPSLVHFSYRRYLENALRDRFGFTGTPIVLSFHRREKKEE